MDKIQYLRNLRRINIQTLDEMYGDMTMGQLRDQLNECKYKFGIQLAGISAATWLLFQ